MYVTDLLVQLYVDLILDFIQGSLQLLQLRVELLQLYRATTKARVDKMML